MRGVGLTLSRLPAASALIAGAAILATAAGPVTAAYAASTEEALAIPRVHTPGTPLSGGDEIALPEPLPPSEAARIRLILRLQAHGDIAGAVRETKLIDTSTALGQAMLGYVMADRHLGPHTHATVEDLGAWLQRWPDLPDAIPIHTLLVTRLPHGAPRPDRPSCDALPTSATEPALPAMPVPEETGTLQSRLVRNPTLDRAVATLAAAKGAAGVARLLANTKGLSPGYASQLSGEAARVLFTANRDTEALEIAVAGARACGPNVGNTCQIAALAPYMAGLAAWRLDRPDWARGYFDQAWRAGLTTPAQRAAAAFWAARARLRTSRDTASYMIWLARAAAERTTFHGQIARRMLGHNGWFGDESLELLTEADVDAVAATPEGLRAFALLQVGERPRAEAELRRLCPSVRDTPAMARAVMLVADRAGLSSLAGQLADLMQAADGRPRNATRFRIPRLRPDGGFKVDPALVYALARTESNFDNGSVSAVGARGLMQIMPETAQFIFGGSGHRVDPHGRWVTGQLRDPSSNLDLGQRYVAYLARHDVVDGNLLRLLASWNAGVYKFARWDAAMNDASDPLLFIEAIPADETRAFVPRVMAYTWIYAARLRVATPSLDELAAGEWPQYHPLAGHDDSPRLN